MSDHFHIVFAPGLPWVALETLGAIAALLSAYALRAKAKGALWRIAAFALLLLALANPSLIAEKREALKDTALLVIDDSASIKIGDRATQAQKAADAITQKISAMDDLTLETVHVKGTDETDLFEAVQQKLSGLSRDRLAGIIAITDGEVHDKPETPLNAPFHALIAGHKNEIDRRIVIKEAPAYGLVGKSVKLTLRVEDAPKQQSEHATITFRRDDGTEQSFDAPVGEDVHFEAPIGHAGANLFAFSTATLPNELTPINNTAAVSVSGIRDRLRVLLVSGQPHIGGRTWRNFLKADPAVDLVHFTILRSPMKMDTVPNTELSLIAFPVHELFEVKLSSFDLVIFDRFRQQSLVPDEYLENIAKYVENGGALLISNSTDTAVPPLTLSPLARILPTEPTGRLLTNRFVPDLSEAGQRHPVTSALPTDMPREKWGPWFREVEARAKKGEVLMTGINGSPLLVLDHVGNGRVAQFLSDQFWLWSRGYENGGPQAEMLRRVAHWLVQEPELDETALRAHGDLTEQGWQLTITRQSLHDSSADISVIGPDNQTTHATLAPSNQPGILTATMPVKDTGLYHLNDGKKDLFVMVGPKDAPEFGDIRATSDVLAPIVKSSGGGTFWLDDHPDGPSIQRVS
ncbi:MAG TPA: hypothetical protein VFR09_08795, partial [Alphaproteobacteria bacterium]|nr:hypothetical protein [Alphaproteobacteria bacterium]